jgi:hypothetical protein
MKQELIVMAKNVAAVTALIAVWWVLVG